MSDKGKFYRKSRDTEQGPMGLQGTKTFCVPHFFEYRKQPSFSLHDLPWVPVGRFKQLLIRQRRGCKTREKQTRAALGQGKTDNVFKLFCRYWKPLQVGELLRCPQACRPQTIWTWRLIMQTPTYLTANPSEEWKPVTVLILVTYPWPPVLPIKTSSYSPGKEAQLLKHEPAVLLLCLAKK